MDRWEPFGKRLVFNVTDPALTVNVASFRRVRCALTTTERDIWDKKNNRRGAIMAQRNK